MFVSLNIFTSFRIHTKILKLLSKSLFYFIETLFFLTYFFHHFNFKNWFNLWYYYTTCCIYPCILFKFTYSPYDTLKFKRLMTWIYHRSNHEDFEMIMCQEKIRECNIFFFRECQFVGFICQEKIRECQVVIYIHL